MNKYTYIILPIEKLDYINFSQVQEDKNSVRKNIDETEFIVKFTGDTPADLVSYRKYTNSEIREVLNNPENGWVKNN